MRFSELDGRRVAIWGIGRETRSFVRQLRLRLSRAEIVAAVCERPEDRDAARELLGADVGVAPADVDDLGCDVLVRSPGVSVYRPELQRLRRRAEVATATGLWLAEHGPDRVVAVTGTKGKSTTATAIAHLLRAGGLPVALAGNIGAPALDLLGSDPDAWTVLELSSYQTADLVSGAQVAVLTNLSREHVDWHGDEATYRADKLRLLALPGTRAVVLPADSDAPVGADIVHRFGGAGQWRVDGAGTIRDPNGRERVPSGGAPLLGRHNALNLCAALTAVSATGAPEPRLPGALAGLEPLPHRLQPVAGNSDADWVDDSISTTPESALAALDAYPERAVVLIAGGTDRLQDYGELGRRLAERRAVVLGVGPTGGRLVDAARAAGLDDRRARVVDDLPAAVRIARERVEDGGLVLLSPAAPSHYAYRDFAERGDHFAALVRGEQPDG